MHKLNISASRQIMAEIEKIWFIGYGSNMDSENLSKKKGVQVFQSTPARLHGYKLAFSLVGPTFVEPRFANCEKGEESDAIHGVAFETNWASIEKMDRVESGYDKASVNLNAYDGRQLKGLVYVNKPGAQKSAGQPSARYLRLLVEGAKAAGLDSDYVNNLAATEVYKPSQETLQTRSRLTTADYALKDFSEESLGADPSGFVSVLGYIFNIGSSGYFSSHRGKEVTNRNIRHFLNLPLDSASDSDNQDNPELFPSVQLLQDKRPDVLDYVWTWFDHYAHVSKGSIVGRHKGFVHSQGVDAKSGAPNSKWVLPV